MATQWYHKSGDAERGPMSYRELIDLARAGAIARTDLVRSTWHKDWQPADALLKQYFPTAPDRAPSEWTETVHAALAARAAHRPHEPARTSRRAPLVSFGWLGRFLGAAFGWPLEMFRRLVEALAGRFAWFADLRHWLAESSFLRIGFRLLVALVAAGLVAAAVDDWSIRQALRTPSHGPPFDRPFHGRRFPLVGQCSRGEYLFLLFDVAAATGALAYFAAVWLESREEDA